MSLFEVAILEKAAVKGGAERLVFGPKAVVAEDRQSAIVVALAETQGPPSLAQNRIEVLVRPFVGCQI